jgi:hypothetical protein
MAQSDTFNNIKKAAEGDAVRYLKTQLGITPLSTSTPDLSAAVSSLISASSAAFAVSFNKSFGN